MIHASGIANKYYSFETQSIANYYPSWTKARQERSSTAQQFMAPIGREFDIIERNAINASGALFLSTSDINVASQIYRVDLPWKMALSEDVVHTVTGDTLPVTVLEDLDTMLYLVPPTRIIELGYADLTDPIAFNGSNDTVWYDRPFISDAKEYKDTYFKLYPSSGTIRLERFYWVDSQGHEPISQTILLDSNEAPLSGDLKSFCLNNDYLTTLIDNTIRVYDVRIPIKDNTEVDWSGNLNYEAIMPLFNEVTLSDVSVSGLGTDPDHRYFWAAGSGYSKFQLNYDYCIFDYDKKKLYLNERYDNVVVDGSGFLSVVNPIWNYFDEHGLKLDTPRLDGETNASYKERLKNVFKFRANSTWQGLVNGISRETGLTYYGVHPSGQYPENLFASGEFPAGYEMYPSGIFPTTVSGIVKINPLYDPSYYWSVVDISSNAASERFVDYTREILETFPILWGSGENDPAAFIWDLAPFDGGANNTNVSPDFFTTMSSGLDDMYFQSGVADPAGEDLMVRLVPVSGDVWEADVHTGRFYIHQDRDYLYASGIAVAIPSGQNSYQIDGAYGGPYIITDPAGVITPSGLEWSHVVNLDADPQYEFTVDESGLITINHDHNGLLLRYEGQPESYWHRLPWDFNPLHGIGYDGFIWVSNEIQELNDDSFTLQAVPNVLPVGASQSLLIGTLLDKNGEPVIGAEVFFNNEGYPGVIAPSNSACITQFDGSAFATYYSPATLADITASGYLIPESLSTYWSYAFSATTTYAENTVRPLLGSTNANVVPWYRTYYNGVDKLWATRYGLTSPSEGTAPYIFVSSTNGEDWIEEPAVTIPNPIVMANGFTTSYRAHPFFMMKLYGSDAAYAQFKGATWTRNWAGLWKTVDGITWQNTWSGWETDGSQTTTGPVGGFGEYCFNSMVVLHKGESDETLFDLGGYNQSTVWKTTDGTTWAKATTTAPWAPRCLSGIIEYQDKIWVIAGNQTAIPFAPYQADPLHAASAPVHTMWSSEDGETWTNEGTLPFDWTVRFATVVYLGKLYVIGGINKIDSSGLVYSNEVWAFDGTNWELANNAPFPGRGSFQAINFNNKIRLIGGSLLNQGWGSTAPSPWLPTGQTSSLTGWSMFKNGAAAAFFPDKTLGTDYSSMLLYTEKEDVNGYLDPLKILLMSQGDSYDLNIVPSGWVLNDNGRYEYVIGTPGYYSNLGDGILDNAHNIDLTSLKVQGAPVSPYVSGVTNWLYYEIDDYTNPRDYGKVILSSQSPWTVDVNITFDTYRSAKPTGSSVSSSGTYLYFETATPVIESGNVNVVYPGAVEITASGNYEGVPFGPKHATIKIGLGDKQQGVFRLDDKFIDYFSYIRWTGL